MLLQRRSHLLSQAAEEGNFLPEPSEEMIARAVSQQDNRTKGQNKRLHSELTPMSEEVMDGQERGTTSLADSQDVPSNPKETTSLNELRAPVGQNKRVRSFASNSDNSQVHKSRILLKSKTKAKKGETQNDAHQRHAVIISKSKR